MKIPATTILLCSTLTGLISTFDARAEDPPAHIFLPGDLKWGDAPPVMPAGAKLAVLAGDPGKPGLFIVRFKFPAN